MKKQFISFLLLSIAFIGCNHHINLEEKPSKSIKTKKSDSSYYAIFCKHPLGHVMKHIVTENSWKMSYGSRNGVYRFRDVQGVYHENSGHCYSNDKDIFDIDGNLKSNK
jgi:hypothetical protein